MRFQSFSSFSSYRLIVVSLIYLSFIFNAVQSYAAIDNGANAVNLLGQYTNITSPQPVYTKAGVNNTPNETGFNFTAQSGGDIDSVHHRLFVADSTNNRVLVFNLNLDNSLVDHTADYVLGQIDFAANSAANTQNGLNAPRGVAYDAVNDRLFVVEVSGNRIKVFNLADGITNGMNASNILGQSTFTTTAAATTQSGLNTPRMVKYDTTTNYLYVSDAGNNRIMIFDVATITDGENAVDVLGQTDADLTNPQPIFTKNLVNDGPNKLGYSFVGFAAEVYLDEINHRFFVSDTGNNRVLEYDLNTDNTFPDKIPDHVLGQSNFYSRSAANTQSGLNDPRGITYDDASKKLFVASAGNNRVMVFNLADGITDGENAVNVLGQTDFTGTAAADTQSGLNGPTGLDIDTVNGLLFVVEATGNRVKVFNLADGITDGENAVNVLGQSTFTTATATNTQSGFNAPYQVKYDSGNKRLFISETSGNRVKVFNLADGITDGENAVNVLGQSTFTGVTAANTQAGLNVPTGLWYDAVGGKLYVGEYGGNRVKVFNTADGITDGENAVNVLGQTTFTGASAVANQSSINQARGLAYDSLNHKLYVVNGFYNRITVYDVTTITNGMNAIDSLGQYNDSLTNPQPIYSKTLINNGPNKIGLNFSTGADTALDTVHHRLFVADTGNNRVLEYNLTTGNSLIDHIPDHVLGQVDFATNTAANTQNIVNTPIALSYDSINDRLYVTQSANNRVSIFDTATITDGENAVNVLGQSTFTGVTAANTQAGLNTPNSLIIDPTNSRLYVFQSGNHRISIFNVASTTDGQSASDLLGQLTGDLSALYPVYTSTTVNNGASANNLGFNMAGTMNGIAIDTTNHRLFTVDSNNNRVLVYNLSSGNIVEDYYPDYVLGQPNFASSTANVTQAGLSAPKGVLYDGVTNRLFVSNSNRISVFNVSTSTIANGMNASNVLGQTTFTGASAANTQGGLNVPAGLAYDSATGRLFVAETSGHRVKVFNMADGITDGENAVNVLGQTTFTGASAANTQAGMNTPQDVAFESDRNYLYVAQSGNNRVTVYDVASITDGENAINVLGQASFTTTTAANTQAGMNVPTAVSYDAAGDRLFVAQASNHRVSVFDTATITDGENAVNVLGQSTFTGATAANTQAGLNAPRSVYYEPTTGYIYVSQSGSHRISVFEGTDIGQTSVSGVLYASDGTTPLGGKRISVSVSGTIGFGTTTDLITGAYTVNGLRINAGNVITVFIDNETEKGVTVTKGTGSSLTGIDVIQNDLTTRCDNACSLRVSDLDVADNSGDTDITSLYSITSNSLSTAGLALTPGYNLMVPIGHIFTPIANLQLGGFATTSSNLIVKGTFTANTEKILLYGGLYIDGGVFTAPSAQLITSGDITLSGGGVFNANNGSVTYINNTTHTLNPNITYNNVYFNKDLVDYYDFEETSGVSSYDKSGFGNTATQINTPVISDDVPPTDFVNKHSLLFDAASGQYATVQDSPEFRGGQDLTVGLWFKPAVGGWGYLVAKSQDASYKDWHLVLFDRVFFGYEYGGNNWDTGLQLGSVTNNFNHSQWYHAAFTYNNTTQEVDLYINGILEASTTIPTKSPGVLQQLSIGRRIDGSNPYNFSGNIDEVRIFNRILSPSEMLLLGTGHQIIDPATTALNTNLDVDGNLVLNNTTLDVSSSNYDVHVAGNIVNKGIIDPRGGTVTLDGNNQTLIGSSTFNNLVKMANATNTLSFEESSTQTVSGTLTLDGGASNSLSLLSTASGTPWYINPTGTRNISGVKVKDSTNISTTIFATGEDLGNNINWSVAAASTTSGTSTATGTPVTASTSPTLSLQSATSIGTSSAVVQGTITDEGSASSTVRGFMYGLTSLYGSTTSVGGTIGAISFSDTLTGLICNTTYHYQAYATNDAGTGTSTDGVFTTSACDVSSATSTATTTEVTPVISLSSGWNAPTGGGSNGSVSLNSVTGKVDTVSQQTVITLSSTLTAPLTPDNICTPYIRSLVPIKLGAQNNISNVQKLQTFLNTYEGTHLVVDGIYKQVDFIAVQAFQTKYKTQILSPWGLNEPTGYVYKTTLAKINALVCGSTLKCPVFTKNTDIQSVHSEVPRIKNFLNQILGTSLNTHTQTVDIVTIRAIRDFQTRYKDFILKPLNLPRATGLWYESTRKQANVFMGCE